MSGDDQDDEDVSENEENQEEFQDYEDGADIIEHVNGNGTTAINPNEIELSARGQQILRRLNINFQANCKLSYVITNKHF